MKNTITRLMAAVVGLVVIATTLAILALGLVALGWCRFVKGGYPYQFKPVRFDLSLTGFFFAHGTATGFGCMDCVRWDTALGALSPIQV